MAGNQAFVFGYNYKIIMQIIHPFEDSVRVFFGVFARQLGLSLQNIHGLYLFFSPLERLSYSRLHMGKSLALSPLSSLRILSHMAKLTYG